MEEVSDVTHPGATRGVKIFAWTALLIIVGAMVAIVVAFFVRPDDPVGDPGALSEANIERPDTLTLASFVDTTEQWGLEGWRSQGINPLRGGVTLHDLDADGDLDLVVAAEALGVYEWTTAGFERRDTVEVGDLDDDGLADIWVGRDIGWAGGGDSIYSRSGDPNGPWMDIAPAIGAALEVDAMGLTLADLNGDGRLDAYVSDLGDNEVLMRFGSGFEAAVDTGAARIRPCGASDISISSSWASGAADLNLDGHVDLVVPNGGFGEVCVTNKVVNTVIVEDDPPALLMATGEGTFYDAWPDTGFAWQGRSRGLALGDIDADGDSDIVLADHEGRLHALRNDVASSGSNVMAGGCLADGAVVTTASASLLLHQQSFLGSHAPGVQVPAGTEVAVSGDKCSRN